jgi:hypothetical protein
MDESTVGDRRSIYIDTEGREFHYIHIDRGNSSLGVHFSAFFGDWGDAPKYRQTFGGYFHRLRMLGTDESMDWLFLCDAYGADENGTYYIGKHDDPFVERAISAILGIVGLGSRYQNDQTIMIGSSMGATGALTFGLMNNVKGIIAISPHIYLDISARTQGRERHVSWVLDGGDSQSSNNFPTTRRIQNILGARLGSTKSIPALFIQSCRDDHGVYSEQVIPLVETWNRGNGAVWLDSRRVGGHSSEFATRALLLNATHTLLDDGPINTFAYKWSREFRPNGLVKGAYLQGRRLAARIKHLLP